MREGSGEVYEKIERIRGKVKSNMQNRGDREEEER